MSSLMSNLGRVRSISTRQLRYTVGPVRHWQNMFSDIGCEQTAFRARPRLVFGPQLRLQRCEVVINGRSRLLAVDWAAN